LSHFAFKSGNNSKRISSYDIIDTEEYKIELLEECSVEDRFKREQYYIDTIKCLNKNASYTGIEGNQKTKEAWNRYQKSHYAKNKEAHLARKARYYNSIKQGLKDRRLTAKYFRELPFSL
jgi:hypothetical protein